MFELLPAAPMNAVLPVEMQQPTYAIQGDTHSLPPLTVGTDGGNSVDIGDPGYPPPKKFMVAVIAVSSSVDIAFDPSLPPKKLMATVITVSSHADIGMDNPLPPKK